MPHPVDIHVGRKLRQCRELRGLKQQELARTLGISFQQLQKYESAANRISASRLWQLSEALGMTPAYFFEGLVPKGRRGRRPAGEPETPEDGRSARQAVDLNRAFNQISDTRVRRQVVHLVKSLARNNRFPSADGDSA